MSKEKLRQDGGMDRKGGSLEGESRLGGPVGQLRKLVNSKLVQVLAGITLATGGGGYVAYKAPAIESRFEQNTIAELKQVLSDYSKFLGELILFAGNLLVNNDVGLLKNAENLVIGAKALYDGVKVDIADLKVCYKKLSAAEEITLESFRQIEGTPLGDCLTLDQLFERWKGLNLTDENSAALQEIIAQNDKFKGKLNELTTTEFWWAAGWKAAKQELFGIDTNTSWMNDQPNGSNVNAPVSVDLMPAKPSQVLTEPVKPVQVQEPVKPAQVQEPVNPDDLEGYGAKNRR
jgi:hypothetical protein